MSVRSQEQERQVVLGEVPDEKAREYINHAQDVSIGKDAIPQFIKYKCYSFRAEYTFIDEDLVIHFYLPAHANLETPEAEQQWMRYWIGRFAEVLDRIAREHFEAEHPRLVAKYTEEVASWWFRAQGFGGGLSPEMLVVRFFEKLDEALRTSSN